MKILLLAPQPFYQLRGTPIAVKLLAEVLSGKGYEITVLTYHEGQDVEIPNVAIRRIPRIPFVNRIPPGPSIKKIVSDFGMLRESVRLLKAQPYDLIHAVEEGGVIALVLKKIYGIPYIYDMDSSISQQIAETFPFLACLKPILGFMERYTIKQSLGVIAVCRYLEDIVSALDPRKPVLRLEDISLLGGQVGPREDLREMLHIDGKILMYVGNLEKYQGVDLLLKSFEKVTREVQGANLIIIGGDKKGIDVYRKKASFLRLGNRAHFVGPRPLSCLASYLEQADVLISPRIRGSNTPMKIYSYLDSGKPVVATSLPTHTQVLNSEIAVLVAPTAIDMAQGIISLLKDDEKSRQIAEKAKRRVSQEFCLKAYERKLSRFYGEIERTLLDMPSDRIGGHE